MSGSFDVAVCPPFLFALNHLYILVAIKRVPPPSLKLELNSIASFHPAPRRLRNSHEPHSIYVYVRHCEADERETFSFFFLPLPHRRESHRSPMVRRQALRMSLSNTQHIVVDLLITIKENISRHQFRSK